MARFGLVGPSYSSQSLNADAQKCLNWYVESIESGQGKSAMALYPTPGLRVFATLAGETVILGEFAFNGRMFAAGNSLWEIFADGTKVNRGSLGTPNGPVSFAANQGNQLLVCSGGNLFVFRLDTNALSAVSMAQLSGPVAMVGFSDGYFVALIANSNTFQLSNLLDGTTWPGLLVAKVSLFPDNIISMIVAYRELWFQGNKQTVAYYNSGNTFPFDPVPSGFMEQGSGAQWARVLMDNTGFWLGADERGAMMAWKANGYTPNRVSNHAIEETWRSYPTVSDAIGYSYQEAGHSFWQIYFPSANATWVLDAATGLWHERSYWDAAHGIFTAHRSRCHCFAFGKHLVGDWNSGTIYQMSIPTLVGGQWQFADDFSNPIRRIRRAPHISQEQDWILHHQLQVDLESGLGPQPPLQGLAPSTVITLADSNAQLWAVTVDDGGNLHTASTVLGTAQTVILNDSTGVASWQVGVSITGSLTTASLAFSASYPQFAEMVSSSGKKHFNLGVSLAGNLQTVAEGTITRDPEILLRWSDDGGHSWSNSYVRGAGQAGNYRKRVMWRRLGRSRDRVYEISTSDPIPWRIVDAYLKATPGYVPTERLSDRFRKMA